MGLAHQSVKLSGNYALGVGEAGERRLRAIQSVMGPATRRLLENAGLQRRMRVADLGCGIGTVTRLIAEMVGPDGHAVGVDLSTAQLDIARNAAASAQLVNCQFVEASAIETGLPEASFDVVYCRLLLIHLPDPLRGLAEMRRLLKPGGLLVCEDTEVASTFTEPPSAIDRSGQLMTLLGDRNGTDWNLGRRLYQLVLASGFTGANVNVHQAAVTHGDHKRIMEWTVAETSPALIQAGIIAADELERVLVEMQNAAAVENLVCFMPRFFQVWARKT
jgi:SAM-dependent methyltransferase